MELTTTISWVITVIALITTYTLSYYIATLFTKTLFFLSDGLKTAIALLLRAGLIYGTINYATSYFALQTNTIVILLAAGFVAVIGLSAQETISNVINGILIQSRQLFNTGDFVRIAGITGEIFGSDFFSLHIKTVDNSVEYLNWNIVSGSIISNDSAIAFQPVEVFIHIVGEFDLDVATQTIVDSAKSYQAQIYNNLSPKLQALFDKSTVVYPYVVFSEIGGSSMVFRAYVLSTDQDDRLIDMTHSDLLTTIVNDLQERNISIGQVNDTNLMGSVNVLQENDKLYN